VVYATLTSLLEGLVFLFCFGELVGGGVLGRASCVVDLKFLWTSNISKNKNSTIF
jgi:hypothetical protein